MSFNPKNNEIAKALKADKLEADSSKTVNKATPNPVAQREVKPEENNVIERDLKKPYTFTMTKRARAKLTQLAQEAGYDSSSRFLNDWLLKQ